MTKKEFEQRRQTYSYLMDAGADAKAQGDVELFNRIEKQKERMRVSMSRYRENPRCTCAAGNDPHLMHCPMYEAQAEAEAEAYLASVEGFMDFYGLSWHRPMSIGYGGIKTWFLLACPFCGSDKSCVRYEESGFGLGFQCFNKECQSTDMQPKFAKLRKHLEETTGKKWNFLSGKEFVENSEDSSGSNHGVKQHRVQPTISLGGKVLKGTNGN